MKIIYFATSTLFFILLFSYTNLISQIKENELSKFGKIYNFNDELDVIDINVKEGDSFSIKLIGNDSTGYVWFLKDANTLDRSKIAPLFLNENGTSRNYYTKKISNRKYSGQGGYYVFVFKALTASENIELVFERRRPFESEPIEILKAEVEVTKQ